MQRSATCLTASVSSPDPSNPSHSNSALNYATVERQFAFIRKALEGRPYRVDVRFDPRRGYPTRVCVDPSVVTDDDFGFVITDFKILPNAGGSSPRDR